MAIDRDATDDFVSFDEWRAELERDAGLTMPDADGWGACYGAGLTPAEAIECSNAGLHRERVIEYWGGDIELSFTQLVPDNGQGRPSELNPSAYVTSDVVLKWIASVVSRIGGADSTESTKMYVYAYRQPLEYLAVDIVSGDGERVSLTFHTGGKTWLDDTDPHVIDLAEAIHLTGLIAQSIGVKVALGMTAQADDLEAIRSQYGR